jgi:hypothetical protein
MARFSIGDFLVEGKTIGKVVAIFTTTDGKLRYMVENDGTLQFALENELGTLKARDRAA